MIVLLIFICVILIVYLILRAERAGRAERIYTFVPSPASYDALRALCHDDAYVESIDDMTYRAVAARHDDGNDTVYGYFIYHVPTMRVVSECHASAAARRALERHAQYIYVKN